MEIALALVAIAVTVIVVGRLSEPLGIPTPLTLLAVGVAGSFLPFVPNFELTPELVLYGLLPPLLYAAAIGTSLIDIRTNKMPIISLSVGLVLFTALGVALVVRWLLPQIPFAVAFALGAIVAPPDAVAATAVARRIGLPRRTTTILEGESLLNDATALVSLRTALAAAGLAAHGAQVEHVSFGSVAGDFAWAVVGGVGIGFLAFLAVGFVRKHLTETAADTALSYIAPFVAYVPAEKVHASGVLAVVTAGLLLAHRAPVLQSAASRLSERINWSSVTFILENAVFLLIGLQMSTIIETARSGEIGLGRATWVGLAVLVAVLLLRPLWMIPFTWLSARHADGSMRERITASMVGSWAGMRGVVTLAAALTLPAETPGRAALVLIALIVTVGTLVLQGFSLPALARALDVRGPDPREDALMEATVVGAATGAGLRAVEADPDADPATLTVLKDQSRARVNRVWERLGTLGANEAETPSEAYRRMRLAMIGAERAELLRMRDENAVDQHVLAGVMQGLDGEEAALSFGAHRAQRLRETTLQAPDQIAAACEHLQLEPACATPDSADGCSDCLAIGDTWVHLRMCTECGHVACCDSSPNKHATAHFHATSHPVMRSMEPGEAWRWCYVDEVLG